MKPSANKYLCSCSPMFWMKGKNLSLISISRSNVCAPCRELRLPGHEANRQTNKGLPSPNDKSYGNGPGAASAIPMQKTSPLVLAASPQDKRQNLRGGAPLPSSGARHGRLTASWTDSCLTAIGQGTSYLFACAARACYLKTATITIAPTSPTNSCCIRCVLHCKFKQ